MAKFTTNKLKELIVNDLLKEPAAESTIRDRHDGYLPSGYFKLKNWSRHKKVKLNSSEEQEDKLGYEVIADYNTDDYSKSYGDVEFPCVVRLFVCGVPENEEWDEEKESEYPDDTVLTVITNNSDTEILHVCFSSD